MSAVCTVACGAPGSGAGHLGYIMRGSAVVEEKDAFRTRNLPEEITAPEDWSELSTEVISWAGMREMDEMARHGNRRGRARTHYKVWFSFDDEFAHAETEEMLDMVEEWADEAAPDSRWCAMVHRDTDHPHVHLYLDARLETGKKISWSNYEYTRLDEKWSGIYTTHKAYDQARRDGREHPTVEEIHNPHQEYLEKKWETRQWKADLAQHYASGGAELDAPPAPERAGRRPTREEGIERSRRYEESPFTPVNQLISVQEAQNRTESAQRMEANRSAQEAAQNALAAAQRLRAEVLAAELEEQREAERAAAEAARAAAARQKAIEALPSPRGIGDMVHEIREAYREQYADNEPLLELLSRHSNGTFYEGSPKEIGKWNDPVGVASQIYEAHQPEQRLEMFRECQQLHKRTLQSLKESRSRQAERDRGIDLW